MKNFKAKRLIQSYTMKVPAKPEIVFPLLCPEREKEWIDDWSYEMIYSESGVAELGCVWKTDLPEEGEAYWIMSKCNSPNEGEYIRFLPGLMIVNLAFQLKMQEDDTTTIKLTHIFTGITETGNQIIEREMPASCMQHLQRIENSLNHFILTGRLLKTFN